VFVKDNEAGVIIDYQAKKLREMGMGYRQRKKPLIAERFWPALRSKNQNSIDFHLYPIAFRQLSWEQ